MTKIEEIRKGNLAILVEESHGVGKLAVRIGRNPSQLSQWIHSSPDSRTGKPRRVSSDICREIEKKCGKPDGWMDVVHAAGESWAENVDTHHIIQMLDALTPRQRAAVLQVIESYQDVAVLPRREPDTATLRQAITQAEQNGLPLKQRKPR